MYNRTTHQTAPTGRLYLCPEIMTHPARPPPVFWKAINQQQGGQLMYYHTCPYCGANLDPDEHCDCLARIRGKAPKTNHMEDMRARSRRRTGRALY